MRSTRLSVLHGAFLLAGLLSCRDGKREAAQHSSTLIGGHIRVAREGLDQLTRSFVPILEGLAPSIAVPLGQHNVENVRFALLGMNDQRTPAGTLTFFPTGFIAAIGLDGNAIARNIAEPDDLMRGLPMATLFPVIHNALAGTSGMGIGEFPAAGDQPSRAYLVAAAPVRDVQGTIVGVLSSGISYGQIAHALDRAVRTRAGQEPVLWVGLRHNGRVFPAGRDRDVAERWLIPAGLIAQIPGDADQRLGNHSEYVWTFIENGERGWAAGLGALAPLQETSLIVFRSEAQQN